MIKNKKKKLATVHDVAHLAQVSPATVSRVFDPKWKGRIRESTREKVLDASKSLGYTPNAIARSLYTNRTNIIAIVVGDYVGPFYSEIFFNLIKKIEKSGKQTLVFSADPKEGVERIVSQVHQYRVDAILVMANATNTYIEEYFAGNGTPVVLFDRVSNSPSISCVCSDNLHGANMAADYLYDRGYLNAAYISGDANQSGSPVRTLGFIEQLLLRGGSLAAREDGDFTYESGAAAMNRLLDKKETIGFDAVFCADDTMAMGAMDAARARGFSIPEDFAVMGFDDHVAANLPPYRLSTIRHQKEKLYDAVIEVLEKVIETPDETRHIFFPMEVVERATTVNA